MYHTDLNQDFQTQEDKPLIEFGSFLIARYLEAAERRTHQSPPAFDCPWLLARLEALLSTFLDKSSEHSVTLVSFNKDDDGSYLIDFNTHFQTSLQVETLLREFFRSQESPASYYLSREYGPSSDRLRLIPDEKGYSKKPPIGIAPDD